VVPHAGFLYSGAIAARAYAAVAAERPPHSVLVLGVDHHGLATTAALSDRDWQTPLGPTSVDHELVHLLDRPPVEIAEAAHRAEHSIEVQLPFLEYVLPKPRFAPLMVRFGALDTLHRVAETVRQAVAGRDVLLVASTDFSHYVPASVAERLDRMAIDQILAGNADGLYETVQRQDISMCGVAPTTVLLAAVAGEKLTARLLAWGHSGEVEPMRDVVGYASLLLESGTDL
jgi:hypothetical protein